MSRNLFCYTDWQEGYLSNVWCKFRFFITPQNNLFVIAKQSSKIKVFRLENVQHAKILDLEFNEAVQNADETTTDNKEIPKFLYEDL